MPELDERHQELVRAQRQWATFVDANVLGILVAALDPPRVLMCNDAYLGMLGYTREDFERDGLDWNAMTPPEWHDADLRGLRELREQRVMHPYEKEYVRKDGRRAQVIVSGAMLPDSDNEAICYAMDRSEQHAAEQRERTIASRVSFLAELGRTLAETRDVRSVFDATLQVVVPELADWALFNIASEDRYVVAAVRHADDDRNRLAQDLVGNTYVTADPRVGTAKAILDAAPVYYPHQPDELVRAALVPKWQPLLDELGMQSSIVLPLIVSGRVFGTLVLVWAKHERALNSDETLFFADIALRAALAIENARRLEEERLLHEQIARSEREFRAMADSVPVIVWTADASGWIDWYNRRWYDYTGQRPEEAAGWGWQAAHHPDDFPRVMDEWPHSIATGKPFEMEFRLRRYDGEYHTFLTRIQPFKNERGEIVRWYGSNVDIQTQKEALERTRRVAETLQGVFLPEDLPESALIRFDAIYESAERDAMVGGDWFDAVRIRDDCYLVSVGDVAGHGLSASITAGRLRYAIRDYAMVHESPDVLLAAVNRIMIKEFCGTFATAIVGFIDTTKQELVFSSAGHPAPILAREGVADVLSYGGLPLGVSDDFKTEVQRLSLVHGDVLAFYTDGFLEYHRDAVSGEAALRSALRGLVPTSPVEHPAQLVRERVLGDGDVPDDAALLIACFGEHVQSQAVQTPPRIKRWRFHSSDAYTTHRSRQELMRFIEQFSDDAEAVFNAELVIGEILANTTEHAPGLVEIEIDWTQEKPQLTVLDAGPGLDRYGTDLPEDVLSENGRGMFLIHALAEDIHIARARGFGTELRLVLPVRRAEA